jgi:predicted nucleic acid-binding protein
VLVVDASVIVEATLQRLETEAMKALDGDDLAAPWLLWSEVPSALNELVYRGDVPADIGEKAIERFKTIAIKPRHPDDLIDEARRVAKDFGWAKTYDAEYLALAKILNCNLVTLDGPLWRRTNQLGFVITPAELKPAPPKETSR